MINSALGWDYASSYFFNYVVTATSLWSLSRGYTLGILSNEYITYADD